MNTTWLAARSIGRVTMRLASAIAPRNSREAKGIAAMCWISTTGLPRRLASIIAAIEVR